MDIIVDRISSCSTTIRGGVKKEEEEEEIVVNKKEEEKEEEEEVKNEEDHVKKNCSKDSRPNCSKIINGNNNQHLLDYNDDYADWTKGNWCWLLPPANNSYTTTHHSASAVKSEDVSTTTNRAPKRHRESREKQQHDKSVVPAKDLLSDKHDDDDELPKKKKKGKLKCCRPKKQPNLPLSNNNTIQDNNNETNAADDEKVVGSTIIKQEENMKIKEEEGSSDSETNAAAVNNNKNNNSNSNCNSNSNSNSNSNNNIDEVDYGYESWTEGNWCLLLPSTAVDDNDDKNNVNEPPSEVVYVKENNTTQRRLRSSSRRRSNNSSSVFLGGGDDDTDENEYDDDDEDYIDKNDDIIDQQTRTKTTEKRSMKYTTAHNKIWHGMFRQLVAYKKQHGSTNVPRSYKEDPKLAIWVGTQRASYNKKELSEERINLLESICFVWKIRERLPWDEMFQKLVAYKKKHKCTNAPRSYKKDPKLGLWVHDQRTNYKTETIPDHRVDLLNSIDFVWKMRVIHPWDEMFQILSACKRNHKSNNVSRNYKEYPKLGMWVHHQREFYSSKSLSIERINHLESIGFIWDPHGAQWMEMYNRLVTYKKKYNSTIVPRKYKTDQKLATWVHFQRHTYNKGNLLEKRLKLLNSINFVWSAKKASS